MTFSKDPDVDALVEWTRKHPEAVSGATNAFLEIIARRLGILISQGNQQTQS
jgi:hypothetical protein